MGSLRVREFLLGGALICGAACGDDNSKPEAGNELDGGLTPTSDSGSDAGTEPDPLYALAVIVFSPDNTAVTEVTLVDSLDITQVDLSQAKEYVDQANIAVYGGKLFVSDGAEPTITRYRVNAQRKLEQDGEPVSFAGLGATGISVDASVNTFASATKAYIQAPDGSLVVWNPTDMTIVGQIPNQAPIVDKGADWTLMSSSNFVRGNRLYRTVYWLNWSTYEVLDEQYFLTYDLDQDKLISIVPETRCPALGAQVAADEQGNAYFSNWFYNLADTLQKGKASACALRLPVGSDSLDPAWSLDFKQVSSGHEGAQLSYIANNQAIFSAYREEGVDVGPDVSPYDVVSAEHWETWAVDLSTKQGKALPGIAPLSAQQNVFTLDGRTFLFAPNQDYDKTQAYEVSLDGTSKVAFTIDGWSRAFVKLR